MASYTYNPATGQWTKNTTTETTTQGNEQKNVSETATQQPSNTSGNLTATSTDKNTSSGAEEKGNNSIEVNTLEGTLNFIVTKETIRLKAGDTVTLVGLGINLSGNYFVKSITRQFSTSGYSHSAVLIKTDFGKSLKTATKALSALNQTTIEPKKETQTATGTPSANTRTYTILQNDTLWSIAVKFYGSGKEYTKIYEANRDKIKNPNVIQPGWVIVIP